MYMCLWLVCVASTIATISASSDDADILTSSEMLGNYRIPLMKKHHVNVEETKINDNVEEQVHVRRGYLDGHSVDAAVDTPVITDSCGDPQIILGASGIIMSPGYGEHLYENNLQCAWLIQAPKTTPNKRIVLHVQDVQLSPGEDCSGDDILLFDGTSDTAPLREHLCGRRTSLPPQGLVSTNDSLLIVFRSNGQGRGKGFHATFSVIDAAAADQLYTPERLPSYMQPPPPPAVCEQGRPEVLRGMSGSFRSPSTGSPSGHYGNKQSCRWVIRVPDGYRIRLSFPQFSLEHDSTCSFDGVHVYDGENEYDTQLAYYCGRCIPVDLISSANVMFVHFSSDRSITDYGFIANYYAVRDQETPVGSVTHTACSGHGPVILSGDRGAIATPCDNGGRYSSDTECQWLVQVPQNKAVKLTFNHFQVETHPSCLYDKVQVFDGSTDESPLLGEFCGGVIPDAVTSSRNQLLVRFVSNHEINSAGFDASYAAVEVPLNPETRIACSVDTGAGPFINAHATEGIIMSPRFPLQYPRDQHCAWKLQTAPNQRLSLYIAEMNIEYHKSCDSDNIIIYDGADDKSPVLKKLCGSMPSQIITSTTNSVYVVFTSDASDAMSGFVIRYKAVDTASSACNGGTPVVVRASSGEISSLADDHTGQYAASSVCSWIIVVPQHQVARIHVTNLHIEDDKDCRWDSLQIYDGDTPRSSQLSHVCGSTLPGDVVSTDNVVLVRFVSDANVAGRGFSLQFTAETPQVDRWVMEQTEQACAAGTQPLVMTSPQGVVMSPVVEDQEPVVYPNDARCSWIIQAPQHQRIQINITSLEVEYNVNCEWDRVVIHNLGPVPSVLATVCGRETPDTLLSPTNSVMVEFISDRTIQARGFTLRYRFISESDVELVREPHHPEDNNGEAMTSQEQLEELMMGPNE